MPVTKYICSAQGGLTRGCLHTHSHFSRCTLCLLPHQVAYLDRWFALNPVPLSLERTVYSYYSSHWVRAMEEQEVWDQVAHGLPDGLRGQLVRATLSFSLPDGIWRLSTGEGLRGGRADAYVCVLVCGGACMLAFVCACVYSFAGARMCAFVCACACAFVRMCNMCASQFVEETESKREGEGGASTAPHVGGCNHPVVLILMQPLPSFPPPCCQASPRSCSTRCLRCSCATLSPLMP